MDDGIDGQFPGTLPTAAAPSFAGPRWFDAEGRVWQEISLSRLVRHPAFLKIVR
jgi:hypothetical protein